MRLSRKLLKNASDFVDLRSDTVTKPTDTMREWMRSAAVGDDVYGDDSTIKELESRVATITGKEAGLFVPSGTMGNLVALATHCNRGDEIIIGDKSHIFFYEGGGASAYMGLAYHTLRNEKDGTLPLHKIVEAIRPLDDHYPSTKLVAIENTHNKCGGKCLSPEYMKSLSTLCAANNLVLHLDGARIFNAANFFKVDAQDLVSGTDSVSVCLSKGLGAPVGSVLVGTTEFIVRARRIRKSLGGGMRQAGIIAAAGLYALEHNVQRLHVDHENAKHFADILATSANIDVDAAAVESNIIFFDVKGRLSATEVKQVLLKEFGVLVGSYSDTRMRAVTHLDVTREHVEYAAKAIKAIADY